MKSPELVRKVIEQLVSEDERRYLAFLRNIERLLIATLLSADTSERAMSQFRTALRETLASAVKNEEALLQAQFDKVPDKAGVETHAETEKAAVTTARSAVRTQMVRDAMDVEAHFQRIRTTAYLILTGRKMGESHAMQLAYYQNQPLLKHVFVDRAGRKWNSASYVRTVCRYAYLELINDLEVLALARAGVAQAALVHPNGRKVLFSTSGSDGNPVYSQVKAEVLHPNSQALVQVIG